MKRNLLKDGFRAEQIRKLWDRHREPRGMDIEGFTESLNAILRECLGEPVRVEGCEMQTGRMRWVSGKIAEATETAYLVCREKVEEK